LSLEDEGGLSIFGYYVVTVEADYFYGYPNLNLLRLSQAKTITISHEDYIFKIAVKYVLCHYSDEIELISSDLPI
jgi:hypothetical protein